MLCPLPVPASWVQTHGILTPSDMFFQEHLAWRRLPDGRALAITRASYSPDNAPTARTTVLTVFDRSFAIERLLALTDLTQEMTTGFLESFDHAGDVPRARGSISDDAADGGSDTCRVGA
jgi:hypothetical protein